MYTASVITISDRCFKKEREDLSGPALSSMLRNYGYDVTNVTIIPDDLNLIVEALNDCVNKNINLILTTGGTGFSKKDITPEATKTIIEREASGLAEYMRYKSMAATPYGVLSRGICGIKKNSIIVNLPGSPKGATENLAFIINTIPHALKMLLHNNNDCANE